MSKGSLLPTRGFTLIELLIVVAIIAILALISVPNFLEAQTRSKVARVKADQRSMAAAIEMYSVDENSYPLRNARLGANGFWQRQLTTPLAYMSAVCEDCFCNDDSPANKWYQYAHCEMMRSWILVSIGPDREDNFDEALWMCPMPSTYPPLYDATNGTVSRGDIWRISKQGGPLPDCCSGAT